MAGALDRRIRIQTFYETQDSVGEPIKTWQDLEENPDVWAEFSPLSAREQFSAQQVGAEQTVRFRIRYRDDLSVEHRILYRGEAYDVLGITEIGRREGLELQAKKVAQ